LPLRQRGNATPRFQELLGPAVAPRPSCTRSAPGGPAPGRTLWRSRRGRGAAAQSIGDGMGTRRGAGRRPAPETEGPVGKSCGCRPGL